MTYWWVNQNQTWKHETGGGYLWSPKRKRNGAYSQFYENMRLVEPSDIVFSFFDQRIRFVGVVQRTVISANKPTEFGSAGEYWSVEGWYVPVHWYRVPSPVHPKSLIEELRPHLPPKYSPLNAQTGDGLQSVYLAAVPDGMADVLLNNMGDFANEVPGLAQDVGDEAAVERIDAALEQVVKNDTTIDITEKQAVVLARRGQGKYRTNLEQMEDRCRITGVTDRRLLLASHVKPWRSCKTNHERVDGHNGLLLAPHIDHLFDRGYISFSDDGSVLISPRIDPKQLQLLGLSTNPAPNVGPFRPEQQIYLAHHRSNVFLGKVDD